MPPAQLYECVIARLGPFHTIMVYLGVTGKRFGSAGLADIWIETEMIAGGSVNQVLEGKHFNRATWLHKITYEALQRLRWKAFTEWLVMQDIDFNLEET